MNARDLPGTAIGSYTLLTFRGQGRVGMVFEGQHTLTQDPGAVRVIAPLSAPTPRDLALFLSRFRAVAQDMTRVVHPRILPLQEYGVQDGYGYLITPLVTGKTLRDRIITSGPLPPEQVQQLLVPIAEALSFAHEQGLVYGSLAATNVLIDEEEAIHLADFGLARLMLPGPDTSSFHWKHLPSETLSYLAPEQILDGPISHKTDLYALGMLLYELLTGTLPFHEIEGDDKVGRFLREPVPSPRLLNPKLTLQTEQFLLHALAKRPEDRYASVQELLDAWNALPHTPISQDVERTPITRSEEEETWQDPKPQSSPRSAIQNTQDDRGSLLPHWTEYRPLLHGPSMIEERSSTQGLSQGSVSSIDARRSDTANDAFLTREPEAATKTPSFSARRESERHFISTPQASSTGARPSTPEQERHTDAQSPALFLPPGKPGRKGRAGGVLSPPGPLLKEGDNSAMAHPWETEEKARQRLLVPRKAKRSLHSRWNRMLLVSSVVMLLLGAGSFSIVRLTQYRVAPPGGARVIFADPLTSARHLWPTQPGNAYSFHGGAYHLTNQGTTGMEAVLESGPWVADAVYNLSMYEVQGSEEGDDSFGIILRCNSEDETGQVQAFYSFEMTNVLGGAYRFYKYDARSYDARLVGAGAEWTLLWQRPTGQELHRGLGPTRRNQLTVEAVASTFRLFVNGVLVGTLQDGTFSSGVIGMLVRQPGTEVAFSQLSLDQPEQSPSKGTTDLPFEASRDASTAHARNVQGKDESKKGDWRA